ncbi:hypothetical protein MtrunA17_Chr5g0426231 [Medicago truncatula]|uniref:Uncharacterized protein n=1 Tax=Medicago truncatula TaxID=3880 RepID=A0A396HS24_MEDTR|nr:hypothetical protein MtrunA17_Chr5g0426231 [Medicago truncatula]
MTFDNNVMNPGDTPKRRRICIGIWILILHRYLWIRTHEVSELII